MVSSIFLTSNEKISPISALSSTSAFIFWFDYFFDAGVENKEIFLHFLWKIEDTKTSLLKTPDF